MNRDDYSQRQKAKDAEYARQYKAWIKSLPVDKRRELEAQGLDAPDLARHGNGSAKGDAADSPLMREGDDRSRILGAHRTTLRISQSATTRPHGPPPAMCWARCSTTPTPV